MLQLDWDPKTATGIKVGELAHGKTSVIPLIQMDTNEVTLGPAADVLLGSAIPLLCFLGEFLPISSVTL